MGWLGRHLVLFLLFSSTVVASAFSDCYSPSPLERFWQEPSYFESNPYVSNLGLFKFYSYSFDNSTQSLGAENISIASSEELYAALPENSRAEFSVVASRLESARKSALAAANASGNAHRLSFASQGFASALLGQNQFAAMFFPSPLSGIAALYAFLKAQDVSQYVVFYPNELGAAYSHSASAYDSAQGAAYEAARLADKEFAALSFAGAGKAKYSGKAKGPYYLAQALLSSNGGCPAGKSAEIRNYFASRPAMPDFAPSSFSPYLQAIAGPKGNSSVLRLAAIYSELSEAHLAMQGEYTGQRALAQQSSQQLSAELSSVESEHLGQIEGISPESQDGSISVGSSFSGISEGLRIAKEKLSASKTLLASSESLSKAASYEGYLSDAIDLAGQSLETSESAFLSLKGIRENAASAVEAQCGAAEQAIALAEKKLSLATGSFYDVQLRAQSSGLLEQAKQKYSQAASAGTLGQRFSLYKEALSLASSSSEVSDSRAGRPAQSLALQQLQSLSSLLKSAKQDGLDVQYEQGRLDQYSQLLAGLYSPEQIEAITMSASDDEQSILLRLSEKYGSLPSDFSLLGSAVSEIRSSDSSFLPEYDSLEKYFSINGLNLPLSAGKLAYLQDKIGELSKKAQEKLPAHLSAVLTLQAKAYETREPPFLGRPTRYHALLTTENPGSLSYNGSLKFLVQTSGQLFAQDFSSGDKLLDVYPEDGKTAVLVPSIRPGQKLSFSFDGTEQPAQLLSSVQSCALASASEARVSGSLKFISMQPLQSLEFQLAAPSKSTAVSASYRSQPAECMLAAANGWLEGKVGNLEKGAGQIDFGYTVPSPFAIASSDRSARAIRAGRHLISYSLEIGQSEADCEHALVNWPEPYPALLNLSVRGTGQQKVTQISSVPTASGSMVEFVFSPISKNTSAEFEVSFELQNSSEALQYALSQAEISTLYANRPSGQAILLQARRLADANRTDEALVLLEQAYREAAPISYSDYLAYQEANASASEIMAAAKAARNEMQKTNSSLLLAQLSKSAAMLESASSSSSMQALQGDYGKAAEGMRKATGDFRADVAAMAWNAAQGASESYARARSGQAREWAGQLQQSEQELQLGNSLFSQGEPLQSIVAFSRAQSILDSLSTSTAASDENLRLQAEQIRSEFIALRADCDSLLSNYSQQYSALSAQSRRQLPLTPSAAQVRLDAAQKGLDNALKAKDAPQSLLQANQSFQLLLEAYKSLEKCRSSLESSARSSLKVAKIALEEVKSKSSPQDESQRSQLESEVGRAEGFLSDAMYADSIAASDRAISSANAFLSSKKQDGLDGKSIALGAISLVFVLAAAYYFWAASKKNAGEKKEKKEIPKTI